MDISSIELNYVKKYQVCKVLNILNFEATFALKNLSG